MILSTMYMLHDGTRIAVMVLTNEKFDIIRLTPEANRIHILYFDKSLTRVKASNYKSLYYSQIIIQSMI